MAVSYRTKVVIPHGDPLELQFDISREHPVAELREMIANELSKRRCCQLGSDYRVLPDQVRLSIRGQPLSLIDPVVAEDRANIGVSLDEVDSYWDVVWELEESDPEVAKFIRDLSHRRLVSSGRTWSDAGEFGEVVHGLHDLVNRGGALAPEEQERSALEMRATIGVLLAESTVSWSSAVWRALHTFRNWLGTHLFRKVLTHDGREFQICGKDVNKVSFCCEQIALKCGVDPSQIRMSIDNVRLRQSAKIEANATLLASVSGETWIETVLRWRLDHLTSPDVQALTDFIFEFAGRPLHDKSDGTWKDASEFGDIVRHIDSMMRTQLTRGPSQPTEETGKIACEILEVMREIPIPDYKWTPALMKEQLKTEFGEVGKTLGR